MEMLAPGENGEEQAKERCTARGSLKIVLGNRTQKSGDRRVDEAVYCTDTLSHTQFPDNERESSSPSSNYPSSRPPTPPDPGVGTPPVSIIPCPSRLTPVYPPKNFGTVEGNAIYRSGFPTNHNVEFLQGLGLRTIVTLVNMDYFQQPQWSEVPKFARSHGMKHIFVPIEPNKRGVIGTTLDSLCLAILHAVNPAHHPAYIHCNQGRHRTGCVVACIRKIQRWPLDDILQEYEAYAAPKPRAEDVAFITSFEPSAVYDYALKHDMTDSWPRHMRLDSGISASDGDVRLPLREELACSGSKSGSEDVPTMSSTTTTTTTTTTTSLGDTPSAMSSPLTRDAAQVSATGLNDGDGAAPPVHPRHISPRPGIAFTPSVAIAVPAIGARSA